jgi:Protein of unknown function (DUF1571)
MPMEIVPETSQLAQTPKSGGKVADPAAGRYAVVDPPRLAMRFVVTRSAFLISMLIVCLMFAPGRRLTGTGDRTIDAAQTPETAIPKQDPKKEQSFADLCKSDPVAALGESLAAYKASVEGYSCLFQKQEQIKGKLKGVEVIAVDFQESPFAVLMKWVSGADRAEAMLFAKGEYDNNLLIVPANETAKKALKLVGKSYAKRALDSSDAQGAARSPADQFGIANLCLRVRDAWSAAKGRNQLTVKYLGEQTPAELNRACHVLHRTISPPEADGLSDVTVYLDAETKLLLGAELKAGSNLLGRYFYRDLKRNPPFKADHFKGDKLGK